ncbi:MAG: LysR substrate-binding domain-containing protein [Myxococcota bacterium]
MDLLSLRLFLRVAELGGVSAAARDLALSAATASARLAKLEERLGFRLFNRTTRAVSLTTNGAEFLPYAQQALESLDAGVHTVKGEGAPAQGLLRLTMPGSFGRIHVVPRLEEFLERYPQVTLDLRMSDEVLDVVEGAYDLIIRNAPLNDSSIIARKLAADRRILVASPGYLARAGVPGTVAELTEHNAVLLGDQKHFKFESGEWVAARGKVRVNDGEAMRAMLEAGVGIGVSSLWNAGNALKEGRLVEILRGSPLLTESAIWALYPSRRLVAPKVRAMIDFLLELFWPVPPWEAAS